MHFISLALLHIVCYAVNVTTVVAIFGTSRDGNNVGGHTLLALGGLLLALQLLSSAVCSAAAWLELKKLQLRQPMFCLVVFLALPLLGLAQLVQPWFALEDWCADRDLAGRGNTAVVPVRSSPVRASQQRSGRFHCRGSETVLEGVAFAGICFYLLIASGWSHELPELSMKMRLLLWNCAGFSLLSSSLALVEVDRGVSETTAACLEARPGVALLLHLLCRTSELFSRLWSLGVLATLLQVAGPHISSSGYLATPLFFLIDSALTAWAVTGHGGYESLSLLLAFPSMAANPVRFVDSSAWSIRARKASCRIAAIRGFELLAAILGAAAWLTGCSEPWFSGPRTGSWTSWQSAQDFFADGRNSLLVAGAASVLIYPGLALAVGGLHAAQVRADGLHRAAARGDAEALSRLLRDANAAAALFSAARRSLLTTSGLNSLGPAGQAPLHLAVRAGAERAVRVLLSAKADVGVTGEESGETPLMLAAEAGHDRVLQLLLGNGASQTSGVGNVPDGDTALHFASRGGHSSCVHLLLRSRADPGKENASGLSAFDLVKRSTRAGQPPKEPDTSEGWQAELSLQRSRALAELTNPGVLAASQTSLSTPASQLSRAPPARELPAVPPLPLLSMDRPSGGAAGVAEQVREPSPRLQQLQMGLGIRSEASDGPASVDSRTSRLTARSGMLDVQVLAAQDSALDELLAQAAAASARPRTSLNSVNSQALGADILSASTDGLGFGFRRQISAGGGPTLLTASIGQPKVTGLASLVAFASPGALRCVAWATSSGTRRVSRSRGRIWSSPLEADALRSRPRSSRVLLSNFRIVGLLGEGTFGTVYEACDLRPDPGLGVDGGLEGTESSSSVASERRCALKILHRRQYRAQDMLERAKQELQVLKAAKHPFVVQLFCAFRTPSQELALVMEYCCNGNLNDLIVRVGRPGLHESLARKLLAEVLLALEYLHEELDVVFRDLKPENVVLDAAMHAKLTDFGLAKVDATRGAHSFVGSTYFVAPEVTPACLESYGAAVDIYALGLVAWISLTGGIRAAEDDERRDNWLLFLCFNKSVNNKMGLHKQSFYY
ncbi:unnamed protein product [Polarella glacialis]|uniref:non-specific serine/threonine protein kinase n=1 Tax=Polarella glacialis TaxID=89957 RepID=A0A813E735_POLGL|nr:unnamed protein product [Polarella glacialis]